MSVERMRMESGINQAAMREMWGAFPPCTMVGIEEHKAVWRKHVCAECMSPINIGDRYRRVVYRDDESNKLAQYKTHIVCPYGWKW